VRVRGRAVRRRHRGQLDWGIVVVVEQRVVGGDGLVVVY